MGICIFLINADFFIERRHEHAMLEAIQRLDPESATQATGVRGELHFAFVDTIEYKAAEDIFEAFRAWRWALDVDDEENINFIEFRGEKLGDDRVLFEAIAPFVRAGSSIEMARDDGIVWRWFFDKGKCYEQVGEVVYEQPST